METTFKIKLLICLFGFLAIGCQKEDGKDDIYDAGTAAPNTGHFSIDGEKYQLSQGLLLHRQEKWHSLFLYHDMTYSDSNGFVGVGNIVCFDVLAGSSKWEIEGQYQLSEASFDGDSIQVVGMSSNTVYNGFCAFAYDYDYNKEAPSSHNLADMSISNFVMDVEKDDVRYNISISFNAGEKDAEVVYNGTLDFAE